MTTDCLFMYKAHATRVYDGDTCTVDLDLGFDIFQRHSIRLKGINTPELKGATRIAGLAARDALAGMIEGREVIVRTHKDKAEKYGRYLGTIFVQQGDVLVDVNEYMVRAGHAIPFMAD